MRKRWIGWFNRTMGETGKGVGVGALAGGFAGLLLSFTRPFNRRRRSWKAARVAGIGAAAGGAIGASIWKMPGHSGTGDQPGSPASDRVAGPEHWPLFREQVIELQETAEALAIRKEVRQVEEVVIHPVVTERVATIRDSVRLTELDIQRGAGPTETVTIDDAEARLGDRDARG